MTFSFKALAECQRCGEFLQSSDEECGECAHLDLRRFRFEHLATGEVKVVMAAKGRWAWKLLMKEVDEPLPWRSLESGQTSLHKKRYGQDMREIWEGYQ